MDRITQFGDPRITQFGDVRIVQSGGVAGPATVDAAARAAWGFTGRATATSPSDAVVEPRLPPARRPRTALEAAIESDHLTVGAGIELLDRNENLVEDLTADLDATGGEVALSVYNSIHRTARFRLSRNVDWGSCRFRLYMTITTPTDFNDDEHDYGDGVYGQGYVAGRFTTRRFDLGVFVPAIPERNAGERPSTYEVEAFDKLELVSAPHGRTEVLPAGVGVVGWVGDLIAGTVGSNVGIRIDPPRDGVYPVASATRVWPVDEQTTTLTIINDALASIGYRGLWVDRVGRWRSTPYQSPAEMEAAYEYDANDVDSTIVGETRSESTDYFRAPNRLVFIRDVPEGGIPVEGNGIHTIVNQGDGPTSVNARGRTITRVVKLDAVDQASLVAQGQAIADQEARVARKITMTAGPNPLLDHFTVVSYRDDDLGVDGRYLVTDWSLPLDGADMSLNLREV